MIKTGAGDVPGCARTSHQRHTLLGGASYNRYFKRAVEKMTGVKVMVIGPGIKTGLSIQIDSPAQLGSDLVADAVGGISGIPFRR